MRVRVVAQRSGRELGRMEIVDGRLAYTPTLTVEGLVASRQGPGWPDPEADPKGWLAAVAGWSNGYVTTTPVED